MGIGPSQRPLLGPRWRLVSPSLLQKQDTNQLIEEGTLYFQEQSELQYAAQLLTKRIQLRHENIVQVTCFFPNNNSLSCSSSTTALNLQVYTEYAGHNLNQYRQLNPISDRKECLCFSVVQGALYLQQFYGSFQIRPQMVFLRQETQGNESEAKVWVHSCRFENEPERSCSQKDMVESLVRLLDFLQLNQLCRQINSTHLYQLKKSNNLEFVSYTISRFHGLDTSVLVRERKSRSVVTSSKQRDSLALEINSILLENQKNKYENSLPSSTKKIPARYKSNAHSRNSKKSSAGVSYLREPLLLSPCQTSSEHFLQTSSNRYCPPSHVVAAPLPISTSYQLNHTQPSHFNAMNQQSPNPACVSHRSKNVTFNYSSNRSGNNLHLHNQLPNKQQIYQNALSQCKQSKFCRVRIDQQRYDTPQFKQKQQKQSFKFKNLPQQELLQHIVQGDAFRFQQMALKFQDREIQDKEEEAYVPTTSRSPCRPQQIIETNKKQPERRSRIPSFCTSNATSRGNHSYKQQKKSDYRKVAQYARQIEQCEKSIRKSISLSIGPKQNKMLKKDTLYTDHHKEFKTVQSVYNDDSDLRQNELSSHEDPGLRTDEFEQDDRPQRSYMPFSYESLNQKRAESRKLEAKLQVDFFEQKQEEKKTIKRKQQIAEQQRVSEERMREKLRLYEREMLEQKRQKIQIQRAQREQEQRKVKEQEARKNNQEVEKLKDYINEQQSLSNSQDQSEAAALQAEYQLIRAKVQQKRQIFAQLKAEAALLLNNSQY